jgi:phage baseplate assembly protein W
MANIGQSSIYVTNIPKTTYAIDLPFRFSKAGTVSVVPDTSLAAYQNKVVSLLSIGMDQRIWYHYFGVDITNMLFENTNLVINEASQAVADAFSTWAPELTLLSVTADYENASGTLSLNISYQTPSGNQGSVKINNASLTAAGEIRN